MKPTYTYSETTDPVLHGRTAYRMTVVLVGVVVIFFGYAWTLAVVRATAFLAMRMFQFLTHVG